MTDDEDDSQQQQEEFGQRFGAITGDESEQERDARDTHNARNAKDTAVATDASDTPDASDTGDTDGTPVREQKRKTLYLPPDLVEDLELTYDAINLRWRQAGNEPLEKHPDYYEQLLRHALEDLGDVQERDLEEIADMLGLEG